MTFACILVMLVTLPKVKKLNIKHEAAVLECIIMHRTNVLH